MLRRAVGRSWAALGAAMALAATGAWGGGAAAAPTTNAGPSGGGAGGLGLQLDHPRTLLKVGHSYPATIIQPSWFKHHGFRGGERGEPVTIAVDSAGHLTVSLDGSGESHGFSYGPQGGWTADRA